MRILKFFFTSLIGALGLGVILFFFGREIVLVVGGAMLKSDFNSLLDQSFASECVQQFGYAQESYNQIRFLSPRNYNLEVVCADFVDTPIKISEKQLPLLVNKTSATTGFILSSDDAPNFIQLHALGRTMWVYTDGGDLHTNYLTKADLDYEAGPESVCSAYNATCCALETESGVGAAITTATDCPKSCYAACSLRPTVLSFNSRPGFDPSERVVEVRAGEPVTLSYVIANGKSDVFAGQLIKDEQISWLQRIQALFRGQPGQHELGLSLPVTVMVDLGDGTSWQGQLLQDTFDHVYECANRTCFFQVRLTASDAAGVLSADNELAKMVVKVNR